MQFEFDPVKNDSNIRKHKVSFEEASEIWDDPNLVVIPARKRGGKTPHGHRPGIQRPLQRDSHDTRRRGANHLGSSIDRKGERAWRDIVA